MSSLYPPESNHVESMDALVKENSAFFVGYLGVELVVCGAAKIAKNDGVYGEIKRVYVAEEHRGKNLATAIMEHLEDHLRRKGIDIVRLEAGPKQPAALSFYRKLGYKERGRFGRYSDDPLSVFMEKTLSN
jgi:putative acetyltransferase